VQQAQSFADQPDLEIGELIEFTSSCYTRLNDK